MQAATSTRAPLPDLFAARHQQQQQPQHQRAAPGSGLAPLATAVASVLTPPGPRPGAAPPLGGPAVQRQPQRSLFQGGVNLGAGGSVPVPAMPPPPPMPPATAAASCLQVSRRQEGNPLLRHIRNVRWQFADIVPDYLVGADHAVLFLSLRCV